MPDCSRVLAVPVVLVRTPPSVALPVVAAVSVGTPVCSRCWAARVLVVAVVPVWVPEAAAMVVPVEARASWRCGVLAGPVAPVVSVPVVVTAVSVAAAGCCSATAAPVVPAAPRRASQVSAVTAAMVVTPGRCRFQV